LLPNSGVLRAESMTKSIRFKTLWVGGQLSLYEKACLTSFVKLGQSIELFTYEDLEVPKGVEVRKAEEILPKECVRKNPKENSYSTFADFFRYHLLHKEGGCWVDTDVVLLRVPDWPETVCGYEDDIHINNAVLSLPTDICKWLIDRCNENGYDKPWGTNGPLLITKAVKEFGLTPLPRHRLYPIPPCEWRQLLVGEPNFSDSDCVHLWNEGFRRANIPKDRIPSGWLGKKFTELLED
jgi:hypothetical protein